MNISPMPLTDDPRIHIVIASRRVLREVVPLSILFVRNFWPVFRPKLGEVIAYVN